MKSSKHQKIPFIDLTESDYNLIPKLRHAFSTIGFVQVRGHSVNPTIISQLRRHLIAYFNRPLKLKLQEAITRDNYRGYIPLGFFSPNVKGKTPDNYEGYKLHHEVASDEPIRELLIKHINLSALSDTTKNNKYFTKGEDVNELLGRSAQAMAQA